MLAEAMREHGTRRKGRAGFVPSTRLESIVAGRAGPPADQTHRECLCPRSARVRASRLTHPTEIGAILTLLPSESEAAKMEPATNTNPPPASPPRARRIVLGVLRWAGVVVGLLIAILAYIVGLLPMILEVALAAGAVWGFGSRLVSICRGKLTLARLAAPRPRAAARPTASDQPGLFWAAAGLLLIWILPAALIEPDDYRGRSSSSPW